jgi:hypothetical protein
LNKVFNLDGFQLNLHEMLPARLSRHTLASRLHSHTN